MDEVTACTCRSPIEMGRCVLKLMDVASKDGIKVIKTRVLAREEGVWYVLWFFPRFTLVVDKSW